MKFNFLKRIAPAMKKPIDKVVEIPEDTDFKEQLLKAKEKAEIILPELFADAVKPELMDSAARGSKGWKIDLRNLSDPFENIRNVPNFCENLSEILGGCEVYFEFKSFDGTYLFIWWANDEDEEAEGGTDDE